MLIWGIVWTVFALALIPALVYGWNFKRFTRPRVGDGQHAALPKVSLLIPARNEEHAIGPALAAALASRGVDLEVIVLDDHSDDRTAQVVLQIARNDPRVRLHTAPALAQGWCGKQHACWHLAHLARHETICWIDADVRLQPDGLAGALGFLRDSRAELVSAFPRQVNESAAEKLVIPLIQFVLLSYLPLSQMRRTTDPAFGAGCGQFFMTNKTSYFRVGGHQAIRASLHDGIMLPRLYRRAGLRTDLFDGTQTADCRMYDGFWSVWKGFAKNAIEGMAGPKQIGLWTVLLLGGQVMPWVLLAWMWAQEEWTSADPAIWVLLCAGLLGVGVRLINAVRLRQSISGALLHPVGVLLLIAIQWYALARFLLGVPEQWRGRACGPLIAGVKE